MTSHCSARIAFVDDSAGSFVDRWAVGPVPPKATFSAGRADPFARYAAVRFAEQMADDSIAGAAEDVLSLCRALRDATGMLGLNRADESDLLGHVALAERAASAAPVDRAGMEIQVRALRYLLVEVADGPISAFMADDAGRIIGDGIGRLFS